MVLSRFGWFFLASSHIICTATKSPGSNPALGPRDSTACPQQGNRDIKAYKENIWKSIPQSERTSLQSYIQTWADQNILRAAGKGVRLEYIDLVYPNKSDTLVYLEGNGPMPPRYASFNLVFDEDEHSSTHQKFSIGPLPLTPNITIVQPMDWDATSSTGGKIVQANDESAVSFEDLMKTILPEMEDILEDLVGPGISGRGATFLKQEAGAMWCGLHGGSDPGNGDAGYLLQQGLYFKLDTVNTTSNNQATKLLAILYNGIVYDSISALRSAWSSPGFEKSGIATNGDWTSMDREGIPFPDDEKEGPQNIATSQRFAIDLDNMYVEWMGFSFYMGVSQQLSLALFNINFDDERIIYELQMQEAVALYASNDPLRSKTFYLDSKAIQNYGFGAGLNRLIPGWDCPQTAVYLDTPFKNGSICIFERDAGFPLAHHRGNPKYVTVVKNNILVVRTISTMGNYDYMVDYQFFYDGTIEVTVRASGYIEGTHAGGNDDHGFKIHDALSGAMHDHVINFKLDLDINGTANTMERIDILPATEAFTGSDEVINTMKIHRSFITNENQGKINWSANSATMYAVVNKDAKNAYGEYRGFRIAPGVGPPSHLIATHSSVANGTVHFAKEHLYVTKRKDTEPHSASTLNDPKLGEQHVDFGKFFDSEGIEQEDLVVWFNLGTHHVPHTG
ncbi:hypothetical protein BLS_006945 [Venturia inaequalis]|uniref:Amine oxidase n=1 Tax=Venturia inaequalis TaxID=5025 RepID=A0A8H3UBK7_VENIN|nr:hypothetical protein BLS_006945 [Venturia inaequalis]